ncbi:MAG: hypothetical protein KKH94_02685, partial [Candidatus Omnitrophica bacterium]|nr:hypothetical protein [Candidatus Omnitrophota bacterium]
ATVEPSGVTGSYSWSQISGPGGGTFSSPNSASTSFSAGTPGFYAVEVVFTAAGWTDDDTDVSGDIVVFGVDSETVATVPSNRSRTKLGVGEEVVCSVTPAISVTWSVTGDGYVSPTTGASTTFTASERSSTSTVHATIGSADNTIVFTAVEPSGVTMEQEPGTGIWHIYGTASAGFKGRPYITPNDVSFINIQVREQTCTGTGTGFYSYLNGIVHPVGSWISVGVGTNAKPSKVNGVDTIQSGSKGPPFSNGIFTWPIPWEFRVGSSSAKEFTIVTHQQVADSTGKVTISKGGVSVSKNAADPTSGY